MFRLKFLWQILGLISQWFSPVMLTPDVTNICGPETNHSLAERIQTSQWLASDWLLDQKSQDWGWDYPSTGSAILSLQLANETWKNDQDSLGSQLTIKKLEIEMLHELSNKHSFKQMSLGYLGYYVMALHTTCHDVTDFHGHNLIRSLQHRLDGFNSSETNNYFSYALGVLALCSSGYDVPHSAITTLEDAQETNGCFPFGIDVTSMAMMAMSCMQPTFNTASQLDALRSMIRKGSRCIIRHRQDDGGFSNSDRTNVISTALAAQALLAAETSPSHWQCEDTMWVIVNAQHQDGHFGSHGGTIQILPVLSNRHHGSLVDIDPDCPEEVQESIPVIRSHDETITITIQIVQDGMPLVEFSPFEVDALPGESLFRIMERAQQIGHLQYESRLTQFGNFVFAINNVENDNASGHYWFIYEVLENGEEVSTQTGADGIYPFDGARYHWIYKQYIAH